MPKINIRNGLVMLAATILVATLLVTGCQHAPTVMIKATGGNYIVTRDTDVTGTPIGTYNTLADAVAACGAYLTNGAYTITATQNDPDITGGSASEISIPSNKWITLTSGTGGPYTLTMKANVRHFTILGTTTQRSQLTLENVILDGNSAATDGGGIQVGAYSTLIMNDGAAVRNCSALRGGGVYNDGDFVMQDGAMVSSNTATDGGGVYNYLGATFTMEGGRISNNTAEEDGGGVYNYRNVTFTMYGDAVISGNYALL